MFAEPERPHIRLQDHWHPVVKLRTQFIWRRRDDREAAHPPPRRRAPGLPQAGHAHQTPVGQRDRVGLLACTGLLPFVKIIESLPIMTSSAFPSRFIAKPTYSGFRSKFLGILRG